MSTIFESCIGKCHELLNILSPRTPVKLAVTGKDGNLSFVWIKLLVKRTEHLASAIAKFRRSERQSLLPVGENVRLSTRIECS